MFMHQMKAVALAVIAAGLALAGAASPAGVVNGSLTGPIANGGVPPGWSVLANSPDTMDANNNVGVTGLLEFGAAPSASPDGAPGSASVRTSATSRPSVKRSRA